MKNYNKMKKREFSLITSSIIVLLAVFVIFACKDKKENEEKISEEVVENSAEELAISKDLKWSERMLLSEIKRFPEASKLDFRDKPKWSYTNGLKKKNITIISMRMQIR